MGAFYIPQLPWLQLLLEPLFFLLRLLHILPPRQHFWPHPASPSEGYYTRIHDPETHTTILLILSSVRNAPHKPHYIHFSVNRRGQRALSIHHHPADIPQNTLPVRGEGLFYDPNVGIALDLPEEGVRLEVSFDAATRVPWQKGDPLSSPEGYAINELVHLIPIHWNVYSRGTRAQYRVTGRDGAVVAEGAGYAHLEKNWGWEFPDRWMWIQGFLRRGAEARDVAEDAIVCAGGGILGLTMYMVCLGRYAFWPMPWPLARASVREGGEVWRLDMWKGWWRKGELEVRDGGEKLLLECPMRDGHENLNAEEAFEATAKVKVWERPVWRVLGGWRVAREWEVEDVALEFGGEYQKLRKRAQ